MPEHRHLIVSHYDSTPMHFDGISHGSMNSNFEMTICDTFLIYGPNTFCGCLLELHQCGSFNKHMQSIFVEKNEMYTLHISLFPTQGEIYGDAYCMGC